MSNAVLDKKVVSRIPQRKGNGRPGVGRVLVSLRLRQDVYANLATAAAMERQSVRASNGAPSSPMYMQDMVDAAVEAWLKGKKKWQA